MSTHPSSVSTALAELRAQFLAQIATRAGLRCRTAPSSSRTTAAQTGSQRTRASEARRAREQAKHRVDLRKAWSATDGPPRHLFTHRHLDNRASRRLSLVDPADPAQQPCFLETRARSFHEALLIGSSPPSRISFAVHVRVSALERLASRSRPVVAAVHRALPPRCSGASAACDRSRACLRLVPAVSTVSGSVSRRSARARPNTRPPAARAVASPNTVVPRRVGVVA